MDLFGAPRTSLPIFDPLAIPAEKGLVCTSGIPAPLHRGRDLLFREVPLRADGLDLKRVEDFIVKCGIPLGDYRVFDAGDTPRVRQLLPGFDRQIFSTNSKAVCLPGLALALVERNRAVESINTPVVSEGLLVHELFHNSDQHVSQIYQRAGKSSWSISAPRVGFAYADGKIECGNFVEEGFCDFGRGMYLDSALDEQHHERIKAIPNLNVVNDSAVRARHSETGVVYDIPFKYLRLTENGGLNYSISSIAGIGMELLCNKEPLLFETCCAARSNIDAWRTATPH